MHWVREQSRLGARLTGSHEPLTVPVPRSTTQCLEALTAEAHSGVGA
jgi:hypothetical protein